METDYKFNSYSLTDAEYEKVINKYMPLIKKKAKKLGCMQDDCIQEITGILLDVNKRVYI